MQRKLIFAMVMFLSCIMTAAVYADPPVNDDCSNATDAGTLSDGVPVQLSGTMAEATNDCMNIWSPEVWVTFTITSCMDVTIDFCDDLNSLYSFSSELFAECPCGMPYSYNRRGDCETNYNPIITWYSLDAGTYYYPIVDYMGMGNTYTVNITGVTCPPPPSNNECANATSIGEVTEMAFSTRSADFDGDGSCIENTPNIWYIYTPSFTGTARLNIDGADYQPQIAIYNGYSCSPLPEEIVCANDIPISFSVVANEQYLIEIGSYYEETGSGLLTIAEAPAPPPNDNCENADDAGTLYSDSTIQLAGTTEGATQDCFMNSYPEVWVQFTVSSCMNITIDFCDQESSISQAAQMIYSVCPCYNYSYVTTYDICGNYNPRLTWNNVQPGTYYYPIWACEGQEGPYTINITGVDCPPPPEPDFVVTAPYSGSNTTCGAGNDCTLYYGGEDHVYEVNIPTSGNWLFSLCNSALGWQSFVMLGNSVCGNDVNYNYLDCDNESGHAHIVAYNLYSGTYYLAIESFAGNCGDYTLEISRLPAPCEDSYYTNGEPDYNNHIDAYRDSEYENDYFAADDFTIVEDINLQKIQFICAFSDADEIFFDEIGDYQILANDGGAPGAVVYEGIDVPCSRVETGGSYEEGTIVYAYEFADLDLELSAGTYFLACRPVSSPNYWLTTDVQNGSIAYYKDAGHTTWTLSGVNSDLAFCLYGVSDNGSYEYLPGDANMAAGQWPPSVVGGDVTYLVNYFRGITAPCMLDGFYAAADANGSCSVTGADVTKLVSYFRGMDNLSYCPDYPTTWPPIPDTAPDGWPNCSSPILSK